METDILCQADSKSTKPNFTRADATGVSDVEGAPKWQKNLDKPLVGRIDPMNMGTASCTVTQADCHCRIKVQRGMWRLMCVCAVSRCIAHMLVVNSAWSLVGMYSVHLEGQGETISRGEAGEQ